MEIILIEQVTLNNNEICALETSSQLLRSMYSKISKDSELEEMAKKTSDIFDEFMEALERRHVLD